MPQSQEKELDLTQKMWTVSFMAGFGETILINQFKHFSNFSII